MLAEAQAYHDLGKKAFLFGYQTPTDLRKCHYTDRGERSPPLRLIKPPARHSLNCTEAPRAEPGPFDSRSCSLRRLLPRLRLRLRRSAVSVVPTGSLYSACVRHVSRRGFHCRLHLLRSLGWVANTNAGRLQNRRRGSRCPARRPRGRLPFRLGLPLSARIFRSGNIPAGKCHKRRLRGSPLRRLGSRHTECS